MDDVLAIVLAAGRGERMRSPLPKVLVPVRGKAMIDYVIDALQAAGVASIVVVVGFEGDKVRAHLEGRPHVQFAVQSQQLGTADAVRACTSHILRHQGPVLVVTGDSPTIRPATLQALVAEFRRRQTTCLLGTGYREHPQGLGRITRDERGEFSAIVEDRDASDAQRAIREVNLSYYVFEPRALAWALERIENRNAQRQYYLTDAPGLLKARGDRVVALPILQGAETLSINTPQELAEVEAALEHQP
jgi:bifunctional UDP-N-acetylglucosamine pyrophosphorylase/glucosamine-1-phosphate N-acetyltransferase/UDP-N-acetylglucosamine pyrophosphorylase